jgi:thioredoxin reductase (NADPH)
LRAEEAIAKNLREKKVEFLWNTELKEIKGDGAVKSAVLFDNKKGEIKEVEVDGIFIQVSEVPNSQFAKKAGISTDKLEYIVVDERQRTSINGVYAAGDVTTCPIKQIGTAVGQAIIAATEAFGYIERPYYYKD